MERNRRPRIHPALGLATAATCLAAPAADAGIVSGSISSSGVAPTITTSPQGGVGYGEGRIVAEFDINGGGNDLELYADYTGPGGGSTTATLSGVSVKSLGSASLSSTVAPNTQIGSTTSFGPWPALPFPDGTTPSPYVGIRLGTSTPGIYNYGWIQFTEGAAPGGYDVLNFGYENQVNTAIAAGATSVPLPTSALSGLALGAAAMMKRRRSAL